MVYRKKNYHKLKEYKSNWYKSNKSRLSGSVKSYRDAHKDTAKEYSKKYRESHYQELREKKREYHKKNAERIKSKVKEWRKSNLQRDKENHRRYYESNVEKRKIYRKNYNKIHRVDRQISNANRRARKKNAEGLLTKEQWRMILDKYEHKCLACKRTDVVLTQDHVIPLSKGGKHIMSNIQPLCVSCNSRKHNNCTDYR